MSFSQWTGLLRFPQERETNQRTTVKNVKAFVLILLFCIQTKNRCPMLH